MKINNIHRWDIPYAEARHLQTDLAKRIKFSKARSDPKLIAGIDCAFSKNGKKIGTAVVVMSFPELKIIEVKTATAEVTYPYIPGLLSFREAPVCIKAAKKLENAPDLFLIDGQGIAHGRKAKSRLVGKYEEPGNEKGSNSPLTYKGEKVGAVVRTRTNVKPLFISVGNKCTLNFAIKMTLACAKKYRLPEPTRIAHQTVTKLKPKIAQLQ